MNMKTLRKILAAICATALIVCISVGATIAYLTSADTVENTFTVGQVHIKLDEAPVDELGAKKDGARVKENSYKLYPGQTYDKDPMVTVLDKSDEAYVRMLVTVNDITKLKAAFPKADKDGNEIADNAKYYITDGTNTYFMLQELITGWEQSKWPCYDIVENADKSAVYEFRYYQTVNALEGGDKKLEPLFTNIVIPGTVTNDDIANLENVKITVDAHAIQARGFGSADLAWAEFKK